MNQKKTVIFLKEEMSKWQYLREPQNEPFSLKVIDMAVPPTPILLYSVVRVYTGKMIFNLGALKEKL